MAKLLVALALVLVVIGGEGRVRRVALGTAAVAIGGLVINLLLIAVGLDDLITRNVLALWPAGALTVAAGLGARRAGLLGLLAAGRAVRDRGHRRHRRRHSTATTSARTGGASRGCSGPCPAPGGERAILVQHYRDLLPLSLYLPRLSF